ASWGLESSGIGAGIEKTPQIERNFLSEAVYMHFVISCIGAGGAMVNGISGFTSVGATEMYVIAARRNRIPIHFSMDGICGSASDPRHGFDRLAICDNEFGVGLAII